MTLEKHLQEKGKTDSWINLANQFQVKGTNKQKSDKVRRLFRRLSKLKDQKLNMVILDGRSSYDSEIVLNYVASLSPFPWNDFWEQETKRKEEDWNNFNEWKADKEKKKQIEPYLNGNKNNVLFVGDLHLPFTAEGYLEFCRNQQERFDCGTVIFAGDVVDNHAQSFHNTDPDGRSAGDELKLAVTKLQGWYKVFPEAIVLLGNHDRIIARKLFSVGLSQRWMRPLGEVLNTPDWKYVEEHVFNNVLYVHGEGGTALKKAQNEMMSVACGHAHTEGYVQLLNGGKTFAMQVGTGIDFDTYAFAYAQRGKKPILSCGVILGSSALLIPFIQ